MIYFCEYDNSINSHEIQKLLNATSQPININEICIEAIALESSDELINDVKVVGFIFRHNGFLRSIVLKKYEIVQNYLEEFIDE